MESGKETGHEDLDAAVEKFLAEAYEIAQSPISAFNDAAAALATKADRDRRVIERARRVVQSRLDTEPDHLTKQVASLLRRALELGEWDWA
jgi:flagellar biosynthesis/type III secretory pathway protein FliH